MDTWRLSGDCLDSKLKAAIEVMGSSALVGTGNADPAQLCNFVETGGADCRVICGTNDAGLSPGLTPRGASAPATTPARQQAWKLPRLELVVIRGGLAAALPSILPRQGANRARAASLRLITMDGVRVDHSATSR